MTTGTCSYCARLLALDPDGRLPTHDQTGPVVRRLTGKRRRRCQGSGQAPRRVER